MQKINRSLTMLDMSGDTTISWDEESDEEMTAIIQEKMDEGYIFFVYKPRMISILPPRKVKVKHISDIKKTNSVIVDDRDIQSLFQKGKVRMARVVDDNISLTKKITNAAEAAKSNVIAMRPARGG